ncbi:MULTISPECIES: HAMP domain-containing sensor histidine kinase [unclassified Streptomyces]|uniref:sensor histidine kinase n=1 Tax=unclassified Streptomyces TaxID=2593676 RepID=UPI0019093DE8|nr:MULTISPECIES: HAMP domain-containing sensor histidine kinase [unclassified Streptomyces]MBK3568904.1 HAMP domain-containing histidine kinase [Streptomyces sp. MBT62]MBK6014017.1 HAMP domain-containing histidine kinase [Streptomyces sp. MBT53]
MSGRRRPRAQKKRAGKPRTLRTRLVVASVTLIAVVCAVIGTVTTLALQDHLYQQLDGKVDDAARRAVGNRLDGKLPGAGQNPNGKTGNAPPKDTTPASAKAAKFANQPPTQPDTIAAYVQNGKIVSAAIAEQKRDANGAFESMAAGTLTTAQKAAVASVAKDHRNHSVDIPGLGEYRVQYATSEDGSDSFYIALPTSEVTNTINTLILVEVSVTAAGLVAAAIAGYVLVGVATRPLRRVAATATRVSELPLHTGEVTLNERVPESETDPHTEVGQVGAALNRMLDHVHGALHARQQSEMRVRQFVADASHELRTPLASIRGYAELTRRGREQTGPDTKHALGRIESEAGRMTLLVEDLLLLARLDAGRPLQFDQTDLIPLVVDTISDSRAAGMGHNWRLDLPDEPALVSADAARIQQVLVNLLGNARKHTPPGTTITARVQRRGPWMCVDVEDNGQGIPPDLLPHVFERFARGDSARSRSTGSTGLGLAIVQAVATAHGGAVTVDSVPGRTVFTVHLPALAPAAPMPAPETNWQSHSQAQHSATTWVQQGA